MKEIISFDDSYPEAREKLRAAVARFDYQYYAGEEVGKEQTGPLTIAQIEEKDRSSDVFVETFSVYGWPTAGEDSLIDPVPVHATNKDFLDSLKPVDDGITRKIITDYFFAVLRQPPIAPDDTTTNRNSMYREVGKLPVIHRAYAVAPELFENLRIVLSEITTQNQGLYPLGEDYIYAALIREENQDVVHGIHMAYRILGRLFKVSDEEITPSIDTPRPILNAHNAIYGWN
jgi:hypothetical protein